MDRLSFIPIEGLPEVRKGADLPEMILRAAGASGFEPGDILVVTHKVVSKAAGLVVDPGEVIPGETAEKISEASGKDPAAVQVILDESESAYFEQGLLISERDDGWYCCNAGVDMSNSGSAGRLILLPHDCDSRAESISRAISSSAGFHVPVIICDTHGRALRSAAVGVAAGIYGMAPVRTYIGKDDRDGRTMLSTVEATADEIAGAATLLMGQGDEGIPAVIVRGLKYEPSFSGGSSPLKLAKKKMLYSIKEKSRVK